MKHLGCMLLLFSAAIMSLPAVSAAPALAQGSYAQYLRVTSSSSGGTLNGTFRWDVKAISGQPPIARVLVSNNQNSQISNFTLSIDLFTRIEIPSFIVASQAPTASQTGSGADHVTRTFFWIEPNASAGSVVDTVLGAAVVNGTASVTLRSGVVKNCWTLFSQSGGNTGSSPASNLNLVLWYDRVTGLLVKLNSFAFSASFNTVNDSFLLQNTNINSALTLGITLSAVEWASLTMSILALILGGVAVAVAVDLRHFRGQKQGRKLRLE